MRLKKGDLALEMQRLYGEGKGRMIAARTSYRKLLHMYQRMKERKARRKTIE